MLRSALYATLVFVAATTATAQNLDYKITSGTVTFLATGKPGFLRVNGEGGKPVGQFTMDPGHTKVTSGNIAVHLDAFATGLETRDRHMKEKYLETKDFPDAIFKASPLTFKDGKLPGETELKGTLTLHGVTNPLTAKVKVTAKQNLFEIEADFDILLSDFKIEIPEYAGVTVAEKVKVHTTFLTKVAKP